MGDGNPVWVDVEVIASPIFVTIWVMPMVRTEMRTLVF